MSLKTKPTARKASAKKPNSSSGKKPVLKQRSGRWIQAVRLNAGFTQHDFSLVTGYAVRSIAGWEAGKPLSASAKLKMQEMKRLVDALLQILPADQLKNWLKQPNTAFEGRTPMDVMENGESDRLWQMIHEIDANVAN
ncbi:MAG: antitoxin Xre/MbcA/ParS toxin-binding domain-containing protein [Zavarzinella sp.]